MYTLTLYSFSVDSCQKCLEPNCLSWNKEEHSYAQNSKWETNVNFWYDTPIVQFILSWIIFLRNIFQMKVGGKNTNLQISHQRKYQLNAVPCYADKLNLWILTSATHFMWADDAQHHVWTSVGYSYYYNTQHLHTIKCHLTRSNMLYGWWLPKNFTN